MTCPNSHSQRKSCSKLQVNLFLEDRTVQGPGHQQFNVVRVPYNPLASKRGSPSSVCYTDLYIRSKTADSLCLVLPNHKDDAIASNQMQKPSLQQPYCSSKVKSVHPLHHINSSNYDLITAYFHNGSIAPTCNRQSY